MLAPCNSTQVALSLAGNATRVLIEVRDSDPRPPQSKATNDDGASEATGGVPLVAALSTRWNWYLTEEPPGKVVWCELVTGQSRPPAQPQPTQPRPKPQAEIVADLDILRRLRDHLMS